MTPSRSVSGYTGTAKTLHWLIVALLIAQFIFAWTMPHIGRNTPVTTLISLHFTFGILILAVAIVRLAWRATHGEPAPDDGLPPWQRLSGFSRSHFSRSIPISSTPVIRSTSRFLPVPQRSSLSPCS